MLEMKNFGVVALMIASAVASAQNGYRPGYGADVLHAEEKTGRGTLIDRTGRYEVERVFIRLDRNSDVYIRVYPIRGKARTMNGRFNFEGGRSRAYVAGAEGFMEGRGEIRFSGSSRDLTLTQIEITGESGRSRAELSFRVDNPGRFGREVPVSVEDWNRRHDPEYGGGRPGGGWGHERPGRDDDWNDGGWRGNDSFDMRTSGRGRMSYRDDNTRIERASVRSERNGQISLVFYGEGRSFPVTGRATERRDGSIRFEVDRAMGSRADGNGTIFLDSRGNVERVVVSGRQDSGRRFDLTFER